MDYVTVDHMYTIYTLFMRFVSVSHSYRATVPAGDYGAAIKAWLCQSYSICAHNLAPPPPQPPVPSYATLDVPRRHNGSTARELEVVHGRV